MMTELIEAPLEEQLANESEETRTQVKELRRWLDEDKRNLHARTEVKYLLTFLRGCQFNLDETKQKLENYYSLRRDEVVWFRNRDPLLEEIEELVKLGVFIPLKTLYKNNLVVVIRTAAHDPKKHTQDNVFKAGNMLLDVATLLENDSSKIDGIIAIFDMNNVTVWHAKPLTPGVIKRSVFAWRNYCCTPIQFNFVNAKFYMNAVISLFKKFMSEKMRKSVIVHSGLGNLNELIDKAVLPPEYGGTGDNVNDLIDYWKDKLLIHREWLLDDEKYRAE